MRLGPYLIFNVFRGYLWIGRGANYFLVLITVPTPGKNQHVLDFHLNYQSECCNFLLQYGVSLLNRTRVSIPLVVILTDK
nr:MAG TPA: hypothetical protein [Caudoviricetes sp.]